MTASSAAAFAAAPPRTSRRTPEELIGAGLLATMVAVLFIQVIARFVFQNSLSWSEELSRYLFIWLIFFTLGAVVARGEHVLIDVIVDRMPSSARRVARQLVQTAIVLINVVVLAKGLQLAVIIVDLGQSSPAIGLPMGVVYAALPIGLTIATVRSVHASIRIWRPRTRTAPPPPEGAAEESEALR